MSSILKGGRFSPQGSRVPTSLLPSAIRYEAARAVVFNDWEDHANAEECLRLKLYYQRRAMQECLDPGPT